MAFTKTDPQSGASTTYASDGTSLTTTIPGTNGGPPTVIEWAVDLPALQTAIGQIKDLHAQISDETAKLRTRFKMISDAWVSPSGESFQTLSASFNTVATTLSDLLDDAVVRMQKSYDNYVEAELRNKQSLTPK
jgi:uncharacterized protein YukE